jgi:hypothetical protein
VAGTLAAITLVLALLGAAICLLLDGRGPGFLRSPYEMALHTLFGRFYDFAVGVLAAWAFGRAQGKVTSGGRGRALAGGLASIALLVLAEYGMWAAGGIDGPHWIEAWSWSALVAPVTAALIVTLTVESNPLARLLGASPFVYLGKISYALYLIQSTPVGKGLLYRISPHGGLATFAFLYVGMTLVSAALYELVEEPARKVLLRAAGLEPAAHAAPASWPLRWVAASSLALCLAWQCASWTLTSLSQSVGPVTLGELQSAGLRDTDRHEVLPGDARWGRHALLAGIPRRWREGWRGDLRAPYGLHVFADGRPVPFARREPPGEEPAAFFRGPRAEQVALRVPTMPQALILVREWPVTEARVGLARLLAARWEATRVAALFAAAMFLAFFGLRGLSSRVAVVVAVGLAVAWYAFELRADASAPVLMTAECAGLLALAVRATRRGARTAPRSAAPEGEPAA